MHNLLYPLTVDKKDGCIVKHLGQNLDILFFKSFAGVSKLKLSIGVLFVGNFGKNCVWKLIFPGQDYLWSQIPAAFHNIAVNE